MAKLERTDLYQNHYKNVILTYGGLVDSQKVFGIFGSDEDARSDDPDSVAIGTVGEESLTEAQQELAERNSEAI